MDERQDTARGLDGWITLHLHPERFFAAVRGSRWDRGASVAILIVGFAAAVDRLDESLVRSMLGFGLRGPSLPPLDSWRAFWISMPPAALVLGPIGWVVGGFWTRVRAGWCGAISPDRRAARLVWLYSRMVASLPIVTLPAAWTLGFPSYRVAFASHDRAAPVAIPVLVLWSVFVSHRGATTVFELDRRRARLWFGILPALFYGLVYSGALVGFFLAHARA